jgi:hypothetical protein
MQKLIRNEKLLLFAAVSSAILALLSIAGIIFFIWKLLYVPMAICILIAAHGFYGCPLYLMRRTDVKLSRIIMGAMEEGVSNLEDIAERAGVKSEFAEKLIRRLIKRGYIDSFDFKKESSLPTVK